MISWKGRADLMVVFGVFIMATNMIPMCKSATTASNGISCIYKYLAENHYPDCQSNSLNDSSKCGINKCVDKQFLCYGVYQYKNGIFEPHILGCNYRHPVILAPKECSNDTCVLLKNQNIPHIYECCCYTDLCNKIIVLPKIDEITTTVQTTSSKQNNTSAVSTVQTTQSRILTHSSLTSKQPPGSTVLLLLSTLIPIFSCIVLFTLAFVYYRRCKRLPVRENNPLLNFKTVELEEEYPFHELELLHQGHLSCVKKCIYNGDIVALKLVKHKKLWEAEKEIYESFPVNNNYILQFIRAKEYSLNREFYILTEFHENGSLADFLLKHTLSLEKLLTFLQCITGGLSFLHSSDSQTNKPVIAHRDLKSKNIFVRNNLTCCLGDFGLALPLKSGETTRTFPDIQQVGTKIYMAPEILEGSIAFCWESFLQADVYSLALVMWELVSRCEFDSVGSTGYKPVFYHELGLMPSIQDIVKCVCEGKKRPVINDEWKTNHIIKSICESITESWDEDAYARLTASCLNERIIQLQKVNLPSIHNASLSTNQDTPLGDRSSSASLSTNQDSPLENRSSSVSLSTNSDIPLEHRSSSASSSTNQDTPLLEHRSSSASTSSNEHIVLVHPAYMMDNQQQERIASGNETSTTTIT